jgi:hypothetical protein
MLQSLGSDVSESEADAAMEVRGKAVYLQQKC